MHAGMAKLSFPISPFAATGFHCSIKRRPFSASGRIDDGGDPPFLSPPKTRLIARFFSSPSSQFGEKFRPPFISLFVRGKGTVVLRPFSPLRSLETFLFFPASWPQAHSAFFFLSGDCGMPMRPCPSFLPPLAEPRRYTVFFLLGGFAFSPFSPFSRWERIGKKRFPPPLSLRPIFSAS